MPSLGHIGALGEHLSLESGHFEIFGNHGKFRGSGKYPACCSVRDLHITASGLYIGIRITCRYQHNWIFRSCTVSKFFFVFCRTRAPTSDALFPTARESAFVRVVVRTSDGCAVPPQPRFACCDSASPCS